MFSREPFGVSTCSGASSAWGSVTPESETLKMLIAAMWHPVIQALPQVVVSDSTDHFAEMNRIIASLGVTSDGVCD